MSDRELLELAAKAAGMEYAATRPSWDADWDEIAAWIWNPLENDGDALRLAVKLQLTICNEHVQSGAAYCTRGDNEVFPEEYGAVNGESEILPDDYAATRRAIVRAAAEIAKAIP